ncbi:MAG: LytTR family DNA-binding domain-containing protein, partial [Cyclobacteriaceae bacterium]
SDESLSPNNPVDLDVLAKALRKLNGKDVYPSMINIPSKTGSIYVKVEHILRAEAEGSYCRIYTICGKVYTLSNNLKSIECQLDPKNFFRCHHSHLINLGKVKEVVTDMGTYVVMEDNSEVDISKRRKNNFFEAMQQYIYA